MPIKLSDLVEGAALTSVSDNRVCNAVYVLEIYEGHHLLVTDFGNDIERSTAEILDYFELQEWYSEAVNSEQDMSELLTLERRWADQIGLLTHCLERHYTAKEIGEE
jgi:hypothetical protein